MMDVSIKKEIIALKNQGVSNTEIARNLGINRKTVKKYWDEYSTAVEMVERNQHKDDPFVSKSIMKIINKKPTYNSTNRGPRKYTPELDAELDNILNDMKNGSYVGKKPNSVQIHKMLTDKGFDIGRVTIAAKIKQKLSQKSSSNKLDNLNYI